MSHQLNITTPSVTKLINELEEKGAVEKYAHSSGISQGIQPIVGFNYWAGNYDRVTQTFVKTTAFSVGVTVLVWGITELFPVGLINLFGGGEELLNIGVPALRINVIVAPVLGFVMMATIFILVH